MATAIFPHRTELLTATDPSPRANAKGLRMPKITSNTVPCCVTDIGTAASCGSGVKVIGLSLESLIPPLLRSAATPTATVDLEAVPLGADLSGVL